MARNDLAHYLSRHRSLDGDDSLPPLSSQGFIRDVESFLPPTIDSPRECKTCYAVDTCMLFRKVQSRFFPCDIHLT